VSDVIKSQYDCGTITVADGSDTPLTVDVEFDMGDFSVEGLVPNLRGVEAYQSRGKLHSLRQGERVFPTGSFSAMVSELSNDTAGTLLDLINGTGEFASPAPVSTTASTGDVMTHDITFTIEGTDVGDDADHTFTLHDCHITAGFSEGSPDSLSFSFTMYGEITGDIAITPPTCGA
jgi:hypothetical protein